MIIHTVKSGETIFSIAAQYGVTASRIITDNEITNPADLVVGQTLVILFPTRVYTVQEGDTLESVAQQFGVSINQLWRNNPILGGLPIIYPGQTLNITYNEPKLGNAAINGYAYPVIDRAVLRKTLPYLTYLSIFTYGISQQGMLIPINDTEIINIAREYGVAPIMIVSTLTEQGTFSNELASTVLEDPALQDRLIESILDTLNRKNYSGVDIDFEYVPAKNTNQYVAFITKLRARLAPEGYTVFVALAPKTSDTQPGLLYEGHDYGALGAAADAVLIMTYEWGYMYGPPLPVSPINKVRDVLDYAVTKIEPSKIFKGTPNYGYDWPLPFIAGVTRADTISNVNAVKLAADTNSIILYDEEAQSPFFTYYSTASGRPVEHIVWFEDARSMNAALSVIQEYGLKGTGYWQIMNWFPQNWLVLNSLYNIIRAFE